MGHAAFVDRLGDTFRWKGENVATTQVERALGSNKSVEECTVFGVEIPRTGGRAGMAAVKLREGADFDGKALAETVYSQLPVYALPLFVRVVESMEYTTTFKSRKVDLREQAYGADIEDPLYVLAGRDEGYVPFYDDYPDDVAERQATAGLRHHESHWSPLPVSNAGGTSFRNRCHMRYHPGSDIARGAKAKKASQSFRQRRKRGW